MIIEQVVQSAKGGELDYLMDWIEEEKNRFYKVGWAYLQNDYDTEDALQNTIIQISKNINDLREEKYFSTWVVSIFINECRKILKYKKREKSLEYMAELKYEEDIKKTDIKLDITTALKFLDETFRDAVILKYYSGYSQEEIAEILEIPIGTVKSRIYRGIKALKNILEKEGRP